jgi:hypothetical protein
MLAMEEILNFSSVKEYNAFNNQKTLHPLVSVVNLENASPRKHRRLRYEFYTIFLKKIHCGDLRYGLNNYDYEEGTLIFLARPGHRAKQRRILPAAGHCPDFSSRPDCRDIPRKTYRRLSFFLLCGQ